MPTGNGQLSCSEKLYSYQGAAAEGAGGSLTIGGDVVVRLQRGVVMRWLQSFLICDNGNVVLNTAAASACALAGRSGRAAEEAIAGLGYIEWQARPGHTRICLSPALTTPAAQERLMTWLADTKLERALLVYRDGGDWDYEYLRGAQTIAHRINRLIARAAGGSLVRRQIRSLHDPQLSTGARRAIEYWRAHRDRFDPKAASAQLAPPAAEPNGSVPEHGASCQLRARQLRSRLSGLLPVLS
ncbi:MAG: hypothetical protein ACKVP7_01215 [Hyphomicrobiaceae bacterium]